MGTRGPAPKPTAVKALEGNPGKRPINKREPRPVGSLVRPKHLTGEAAREWDRAVGAMPDGVYTPADAPALAVYCEAWVIYRAGLALLDEEGMMSTGSHEQPVAHPVLAVIARQAEIILRATDRLGMTPTARTRLTVPEPPEQGKFGGLLGGKPLRVVTANEPSASSSSSSG